MCEDRNNDRFVRWQGRQIEEFGKTINLILGICIASIGFTINQLLAKDFKFSSECEKHFIIVGVCLLMLAVACLIVTSINRLYSIRLTKDITRNLDGDKSIRDNLRAKTKILDSCTWRFFRWSLITFGLGELIIIIGFGVHIL
jgi:hypothetical protein